MKSLCRIPGDQTGGWTCYISGPLGIAGREIAITDVAVVGKWSFRTNWHLFLQRTGTDFISLGFGDEGRESTDQLQEMILVTPLSSGGFGAE